MKLFFQKFKKLSQKLADAQIKIILFLVYFLIITPFGIFVRLFKDYLRIKQPPAWQVREETRDIPNFFKKQ